MKTFIAILAVLFLSSCEKNWVCDCSAAEGNITDQYEFKAIEEDAIESCESTENNYMVFGSDAKCELIPQ
jgi:hypothetical protein